MSQINVQHGAFRTAAGELKGLSLKFTLRPTGGNWINKTPRNWESSSAHIPSCFLAVACTSGASVIRTTAEIWITTTASGGNVRTLFE